MKNRYFYLLKITPCCLFFSFVVMSCNSNVPPLPDVPPSLTNITTTTANTSIDTAVIIPHSSADSSKTVAAQTPVEVEYSSYDQQGYFALDYPKGFSIKEKEMKYKGEADPYASNRAYFFVSPTNEITFFAYPACDKTINEGIELDKNKEILVSDKKEGKEKRVFLIRAKDKSYERTYTESNGNIVGVEYKDAATLERYQAVWQKFAASLEVFTD